MTMRMAFVLSILSAFAAAPARADAPADPPVREVVTVVQEQMSLAEMEAFFEGLKLGTPVRVTYANGAEYAGNFKGKVPSRPLIRCRKGFFSSSDVPLERVVDAFIIVSSTKTIRIHRSDLHYSGAKQ